MTVNLPIVAGYWFSALALALFSWRAWHIYRSEHEPIFRYIAEGTALITIADLLYGSAHFRLSPRLLTGEFFIADTALIFGILLACQFPVYYWGRVAGHRSAARAVQLSLLFLCIFIVVVNLFELVTGMRVLVMLSASGVIHDGSPAWFDYAKVLLLTVLGLGAGLTFLYQGVTDGAMRQQRLGLGILIGSVGGVMLTLVNQTLLDEISAAVLALGVALIIFGLFTAPGGSPQTRPDAPPLTGGSDQG